MPQMIRKVPISQVEVTDRVPITPRTLQIALHLMRGGSVPPIKVLMWSNGMFRVQDGRHRWTAHKLVGRKSILVRYGIR